MNKNEKIEEVGDLAYEYMKNYSNCSQCVCAAFKETYGFPGEDVIKAGTGMGGGIGLTGYACGALTGAVMIISSQGGREYSDLEQMIPKEFYRMVKDLCERFEREYESIQCREIQKKLLGRSFDLWDEEEYQAFIAAGGPHEKCPEVVKKAAKWTAEILEENNLI